jgi:hypothetical protein
VPALSVPAITCCAPTHSTAVIAPITSIIALAVSTRLHADARLRRAQRALHRLAKALALEVLARVALHRVHGVEGLAGAGVGVGDAVLAVLGGAAHARPVSAIGSTISGMPIRARLAKCGLVIASMTALPTTVMALRQRDRHAGPTTLRSSSASADRRESSSPERVRSKKLWSSDSRCEYRLRRRSEMTRSPSSDTQKKRTAVAIASTTATANRSRNQRSMLPAAAAGEALVDHLLESPGKDRVELEETASAPSQPNSKLGGGGGTARGRAATAGAGAGREEIRSFAQQGRQVGRYEPTWGTSCGIQ